MEGPLLMIYGDECVTFIGLRTCLPYLRTYLPIYLPTYVFTYPPCIGLEEIWT